MSKSKWFYITIGTLLLVSLVFVSNAKVCLGAGEKPKKEVTLTVVWHAGVCADALLEIAKDYTKMTGVKVVGTLVAYGPAWHDKVAAEFAAKGSGFDLACWDSQSISEFAGGGHCVLLNPLIEKSKVLKMSDWTKEMLRRYGEYPEGSGKYYALPINADCEGLHYRKDLFEDPKEKAGFKKKYGYDLAIPQTWSQLKDIAEWFTRPPDLYGLAMMGGREYDFLTSVTNCLVWVFGGELWNPKTNEFKGFIDSPASIDGVKFYIQLMKYCPPGVETWNWDQVNAAFTSGRVAMAHNWFYFFAAMADPNQNPYADVTGFAILPGEVSPRDGKFRREFSMGGQGMGISKYSKNVDEAWKFLEWYNLKEQQMIYAKICQSGNRLVWEDPAWTGLNAYNKLFRVAFNYTNDYWHLPEYAILLDILQEETHNAITGKKTPEKAMQDCAERQEKVMEKAGYKITRTPNIPEVPDQIVFPCGKDKIEPIIIE
ncbi:MAG: ABC transporter substrate-binding protein [Spirochaetota bacterium]|uniref:ABC transporter substrate-binding protein n=1 Tax=Candidatus Jordarchaeum sp. TaxID=2823881 RepID=UPI00404A60FE